MSTAAAEGMSTAGKSERAKVFVSYSRSDLEFADQLVAGLNLCGFAPTIDRQGIDGGEAWQAKLSALIGDSDTVVFVLSPTSAQSQVCLWEVEEAARLGKRLIPVLALALGEVQPPPRLRELNYIFFYKEPKAPGAGFATGLAKLVAALNTDLGWMREHTRLLRRASEWDAAGKVDNRLLTGTDIAAAKSWLAHRPAAAPEATDTQRDFIAASEAGEDARLSGERKRLADMAMAQAERETAIKATETALSAGARVRRIFTASMVGAVVVLAGVAAYAFQQKLTAEASQKEALAQRAIAEVAKLNADAQTLLANDRLAALKKEADGDMLDLCKRATDLAGVLATSSDVAAWDKARAEFWAHYTGSMYRLETAQKRRRADGISPVETAMVHFGNQLKMEETARQLPARSLDRLSLDVSRECSNFLSSL
jgi:hypothetical protein